MFELFIIILVVVGLGAAFFFCGSDRRDRGSRDYLRTSRTAEKAEQQMERDRDYVSDREKRRYRRSRY